MSEDPSHPLEHGEPREVPDRAILSYQTPGATTQQWVNVWSCRDAPEANLAVARLQAQGLHARVDSENAATLGAWAGAGPGTSTRVQALAEDADAAVTVLREIDRRRAARLAAQHVTCPQCATSAPKRTTPVIRKVGIAMLAVPTLSSMFAMRELAWTLLLIPVGIAALVWKVTPRWRCLACGHRWAQPEPEELAEEDDSANEEDESDPVESET
jgi:hypothetical protein